MPRNYRRFLRATVFWQHSLCTRWRWSLSTIMILERGSFSIYMIYYAQVWESAGKACPYLISLSPALTGTFQSAEFLTLYLSTSKMEEKGKQEIENDTPLKPNLRTALLQERTALFLSVLQLPKSTSVLTGGCVCVFLVEETLAWEDFH